VFVNYSRATVSWSGFCAALLRSVQVYERSHIYEFIFKLTERKLRGRCHSDHASIRAETRIYMTPFTLILPSTDGFMH